LRRFTTDTWSRTEGELAGCSRTRRISERRAQIVDGNDEFVSVGGRVGFVVAVRQLSPLKAPLPRATCRALYWTLQKQSAPTNKFVPSGYFHYCRGGTIPLSFAPPPSSRPPASWPRISYSRSSRIPALQREAATICRRPEGRPESSIVNLSTDTRGIKCGLPAIRFEQFRRCHRHCPRCPSRPSTGTASENSVLVSGTRKRGGIANGVTIHQQHVTIAASVVPGGNAN